MRLRVSVFLVLCCLTEYVSTAEKFVTCVRDYSKIGCFREALTDMDLLINDRDGKGHELDWNNFAASLHSLACRCSEMAKLKNYEYFSIRFWAECWAGKDRAALDAIIKDPTHRSNECKTQQYGACKDGEKHECAGKANTEYIYALNHKAPEAINGGFTAWSAWTKCTKSCGEGEKIRERACTNPVPDFGGKPCNGSTTEVKTCKVKECPVDGKLSSWSSYSKCTKACGGGTQKRTRTCTPPKYGGAACGTPLQQSIACNAQACPVDGKLSSWSSFTSCSKTCGTGTKSRTRTCTPPKHGGKECTGSLKDTQSCKVRSCPTISNYWTANTAWNKMNSKGNVVYLDRHFASCGSGAMNKFHLGRSGDNVRWDSKCGKLNIATSSKSTKYTSFNDDGDGKFYYLDRHTMNCGDKGFINGFGLQRNSGHNKIRWKYKCLNLNGVFKKTSCYNKSTGYTDDGKGNSFYLDRQKWTSCNSGYAISKIHLSRKSGGGQIRWNLRCCKPL